MGTLKNDNGMVKQVKRTESLNSGMIIVMGTTWELMPGTADKGLGAATKQFDALAAVATRCRRRECCCCCCCC